MIDKASNNLENNYWDNLSEEQKDEIRDKLFD